MKKAKKSTKSTKSNDEIWAVIIAFLPYAMRIRLLALSKTIREIIQQVTPLPLLTSATINDAQRSMRNRRRRTGQYHFEGFAPSPDMDSVIAHYKFESNMIFFDTLENVNNKPPKYIEFSIEDVISFAASTGKLNVQYNAFKTRDERHRFITTYLHFSNTKMHPRWHLLKNQSEESLLRLIESLGKYKNEEFKEKAQKMIMEVQLAIEDKQNNLEKNEIDKLGDKLGKLKF